MKKCLIFLLLIVFASCQDLYEVENEYSEGLTIEGYVAEGELVKVYLTSSLPFQGEITEGDLLLAEVETAVVTVNDGFSSEVLTLTRDNTYYPSVYYTSRTMMGVVDKEYSLKVVLEGKTYTAMTSVPDVPDIKEVNVLEGATSGEKVLQLFIENSRDVEYYKALIKNEDESEYSWASPYIFSNELTDRKEDVNLILEYIEVVQGVEINKLYVNNGYDISLVKISESEYNFYKSVYGDYTTIFEGGIFAENIYTNIEGGNEAFGFWCGENSLNFNFKIE